MIRALPKRRAAHSLRPNKSQRSLAPKSGRNSLIATLLAAKRVLVNAFLEELKKHDGPLTAFDPLVFQATVNYVTVSRDCTVTFLFRDGTEATEIIQKGVKPHVRRKARPDGDIPTGADGGEST